ncbi:MULTISPECIES: MarR family winged helix-turn-helix transcriptional regulator [unclassified Nonomuraea]|uniref:MarR family winged helix-turn-helix transcriptional regulator n=1 Tax=unclassified Nonomuraea TaxID=2593643 RepID=UPI0033CC6980
MKPIGYWLNRTDQALTRSMNDMLSEFGLTRIAWQVLNVIDDTPETTDSDVLSALAANADVHTLTAAVDAVLTDGWAARPAPDRLALTARGRQRLAGVAERVDAFRELSMTGISPDEYRTAVRVLERITHTLETATSAGRPSEAGSAAHRDLPPHV